MEAITCFPEFLVRYNTDKIFETSSEASEFPASSNYEAAWYLNMVFQNWRLVSMDCSKAWQDGLEL